MVRFHVSYVIESGSISPNGEWSVLESGTITQSPPSYSVQIPDAPVTSSTTSHSSPFLGDTFTLPNEWQAVAAAPRNSGTSSTLRVPSYVKALIVTVAAADSSVLDLASSTRGLGELRTILSDPEEGQTALQVWESNVRKLSFPPLKQNIRFFQRTIPIPSGQ